MFLLRKARPLSTLKDTDQPQPATSPKPQQRFKWRKWGVITLLLLGSSGIGLRLLRANTPNQTAAASFTQPLERKTIPVRITSNGTITAARSINLSPKSAGVIRTLFVNEGDRVRQGQVIAIMDDANLRGQFIQMQGQLAQQEANLQRLLAGNRSEDIAKAAAQLEEAKANLQQLKTGNRSQEIAQARARLQQAQSTLKLRQAAWQRHQKLYAEGAIAQQTLDEKRMERDVAQNQVLEAEQSLALQRAGTRSEQIVQAEARVRQQAEALALLRAGSRPEDIAQARAQVLAAKGQLQTIQAQLNDTQVRAPFDGVITQIFANEGSFVSPSMAGGGGISAQSSSILTLSSNHLQVLVNLSEAQIAKVRLGQSVNFSVDAFPGRLFSGRVERIAPQATVAQNVTSFEVRVGIPPTQTPAANPNTNANSSTETTQLKPGMNVETQFQIGQLANAILVPNAAVVRQGEGEGVYVLEQQRGLFGNRQQSVFRPIQTGITVGSQTEVKSGLNGNEQILISPPTNPESPSGFSLPRPPRAS
jgi:HlyD family secretion protein